MREIIILRQKLGEEDKGVVKKVCAAPEYECEDLAKILVYESVRSGKLETYFAVTPQVIEEIKRIIEKVETES